MKSQLFASLLLSFSVGIAAQAQIVTHTPANATAAGVTVTPTFGALTPAGTLGTNLIAFGVDYSFGNSEGIFNDPPLAFGGAHGGLIDLQGGLDGRIVLLNTLSLGLTDFVSVDAGNSSPGDLRLSVFDSSLNLLGSVLNTSSDISTMTINHAGIFDIAYFSITTPTNDLFGVRSVSINTPVAAAAVGAVPEPSTYGLMGGALLAGIVYLRRRNKR